MYNYRPSFHPDTEQYSSPSKVSYPVDSSPKSVTSYSAIHQFQDHMSRKYGLVPKPTKYNFSIDNSKPQEFLRKFRYKSGREQQNKNYPKERFEPTRLGVGSSHLADSYKPVYNSTKVDVRPTPKTPAAHIPDFGYNLTKTSSAGGSILNSRFNQLLKRKAQLQKRAYQLLRYNMQPRASQAEGKQSENKFKEELNAKYNTLQPKIQPAKVEKASPQIDQDQKNVCQQQVQPGPVQLTPVRPTLTETEQSTVKKEGGEQGKKGIGRLRLTDIHLQSRVGRNQ